MIDHRYTDNMVCPYCGHAQRDIFEIKGAYDEEEIRVDCDKCEREFASFCHITYSFCTEPVDKEKEAREHAERAAALQRKQAQARQWPPGTRVRVREDAWCGYGGQSGIVANREPCQFGFVLVTFDAGSKDAFAYPIDPIDLEAVASR